jgi:hypothetical protein
MDGLGGIGDHHYKWIKPDSEREKNTYESRKVTITEEEGDQGVEREE